MVRTCAHCQRPLGRGELAEEESQGMEAERRALGLEGVRFLFYTCAGCGHDDIFVDIVRLPGETDVEFLERWDALECVAKQLHAEMTEVIVVAT